MITISEKILLDAHNNTYIERSFKGILLIINKPS